MDYATLSLERKMRDALYQTGLSEEQAAEALGIEFGVLRNWCTGQSKPPRMALLALEQLAVLRHQVRVERRFRSRDAGGSDMEERRAMEALIAIQDQLD